MLRSLDLRLLPLLVCVALLPAGQATAQLETPSLLDEVDPPEGELADLPAEDEAIPRDEPAPRSKRGSSKKSRAERDREKPKSPEPAAETPLAEPPGRAPPPPILTPRIPDSELLAIWKRWREALSTLDSKAAEEAQRELLALKEDVAAQDLELLSVSLLRMAEARRLARDEPGAVRLAEAAVALSPNLPHVRLALAEAYARGDPTDVGRYLKELKGALGALVRDPRHRRSALADLGVTGLLAVLATAVIVVGVLFVRRVRYLLHDFHHLFPRATARWQSATLALLLLLSVPVVFRLGLVPVLLVLLGVVALQLSNVERAVAALLLALAALVPFAAGQLVRYTAYTGTVAEDVYVLERGGLTAEEAAQRVLARYEKQSASFAELFALARFEARRGQREEAILHYRAAGALRAGHAALMTNLGNALLAAGEATEAAMLYTKASEVDPSLAASYFNLAEVYRRRAVQSSDDQVIAENERARSALTVAQRLDPELLKWERPPEGRLLMNRLLLGVPLREADLPPPGAEVVALAERVEAQLSRGLLGGGKGPLAWGPQVAAAALLFLWGLSRKGMRASTGCEKCGYPVCRRCEPGLGPGSLMCIQCVNVFTRKRLVAPQLRARKRLEVERYQMWADRKAYVLGALVAGAGHLFSGLPVRGALYVFLFLFSVAGLLIRQGVLRTPYGEVPVYLKLVPLALLLLSLHILTLRGLFKRKSEPE